MSKLLYRVDGSTHIGYGHLIRCISLAKYCRKRGLDCLFILQLSDQKVEALLTKEGLVYQFIQNETDIVLIKEWSNTIILDINNPVLFKEASAYRTHLAFLKEAGFITIAFEEFIADPFPSDIVIIPYIGAETLVAERVSSSKYLLGPAYFIFRDEFLHSPAITIRDEVKSIFICMGGTDPEKLTEKLIVFLLQYPATFFVKIILAAIDEERRIDLEQILVNYKGGYEIVINPPDISSIMIATDLGVINSGLIKYEACLLGVPCISISNSKTHEPLMQLFSQRKLLRHIGTGSELTYDDFALVLSALVTDKAERSKLSANALNMFDGKGIERVYEAIENLKK